MSLTKKQLEQVKEAKRLKRRAAAEKRRRDGKPAEWHVWCAMKKRCHYKGNPSYRWYGGKGIVVCDRWREPYTGFDNFMTDMKARPDALHDLDRVESDGDYCPKNCRWLDRKINRGKHIVPVIDEPVEDPWNLDDGWDDLQL